MLSRPFRSSAVAAIGLLLAASCSAADTGTASTAPDPTVPATTDPAGRVETAGSRPVVLGEPIDVADLRGRIVTDNFEDVFAMNPDGSDVVHLTTLEGEEFDGTWSPDGQRVAYRDSRRGINDDDEIFIVDADGSNPTNLTNNPANEWGPAWSPDGQWIVFNSDREGAGQLRGYLMRADGSDVTRLPIEGWVEYADFSPDGSTIVYSSHAGSDYDIFVADIATGETTRLTDASGADGWPVWSPDGTTIAFATERDDCARVPDDQDCWYDEQPGEHHDIWLMDADGSNQRRVTPEAGQFVAWSPDGEYLLISGRALFVVRPDGTGRVELRSDEFPLALGGIPDWTS